MMKVLTLFFVLIIFSSKAQNPKGFDKMCKGYIKGTVNLVMPIQLHSDSNAIVLDTRELKEYNTSHIKGALYVGYDNFVMQKVNAIKKDRRIYVYCSVGYRSEKIGEQLKKSGYNQVYNLYGGIFNWKNSGFPVVNNSNEKVNLIHGYNKDWSKWIYKNDSVKVVLD